VIKKIYFWEPTLSPHKTDFYKAIARNYPNIEIEVIYKREISNDRRSLGWQVESTVICRMVDDPMTVRAIVGSSDSRSIHCICGVRQSNLPSSIVEYAEKGILNFVLMAESKATEGIKGVLRKLHFYIFNRKLLLNTRLLFAQGRFAPGWYKSLGVKKNKIINFGYYVDRRYRFSDCIAELNNVYKIGYLGRINVEKGVSLLLSAFMELSQKKPGRFHLTIGGTGEKKLEALLSSYENDHMIEWRGAIPYHGVQEFLNELDLLIVPSVTSNDGWGVVVNEALISGIPVLCSYKVGSSVVVEKNALFGVVFNKLDSEELANKVLFMSENPLYLRRLNEKRSALAYPYLSPDNAARIFMCSIEPSFQDHTEIRTMW
jgi:glycosyltransferase involved in cell wall biosynthesis